MAKAYPVPKTSNYVEGKYTRFGDVDVKVVVAKMSIVEADVIVCSGPKNLQLNNRGLSQSLADVAGQAMQEELNENYPNGIEYGEFAISKGHNLQCQFVYHGALPNWSTTNPDPSVTMQELMDNCLEKANHDKKKSIAFPSLGVGSLSFPVEKSAQLMGECIRAFCTNRSEVNIKEITIVIYRASSKKADVLKEFVKELSGGSSVASVSHGFKALPMTVVSRQLYSGRIGSISISLHVGNLAEQQVDVIVNSVGSDFSMSSGTAAAIQASAGPELLRELKENYPMGIKGGKIAVTKGFYLRCKEVFNGTLLPWYSKRSSSVDLPEHVLEKFVDACLEMANANNHKSIAFPALGTGYHKIPADVAAESIVAAIAKFSDQQKQQNLKDIRVVLYGGSKDLSTLEKEFQHTIIQSSSAHSGRTAVYSTVSVPTTFRSLPPSTPPRGTPAYLQYKCIEPPRTPSYWTKITPQITLKDWHPREFENFYSLDLDKHTYNCIANAFLRTIRQVNAQVVSIERIENASLFMKYREECQRLFRKVSVEGTFTPLDRISQLGQVKVMEFLNQQVTNDIHSEINEYYFFHATKADHVDVICGQGLDSRLANTKGRLGTGVYGAEEANKSHQYAVCNQQNRYPMFLIRMGLGDIFVTQKENRFKRPPCKVCTTNVCLKHQELHDSVMASGGAFSRREFVVYDKNQCYPEYLIWYTV